MAVTVDAGQLIYLALTPSGGNYQDIYYDWAIVSGGGYFVTNFDGTHENPWGRWYQTVAARQDVEVMIRVTVISVGDTVDRENIDLTFTVEASTASKPLATKPTVTITPDIVSLPELGDATFTANISGGSYDDVEFLWELVTGPGEITFRHAIPPTMTITKDITEVDEDKVVTRFLATPSGGLYDAIEYEWDIVSGGGELEFEHASAPTITITEDITEVEEGSVVRRFLATPSGGLYDEIEYEWEFVSGPGEAEFEHASAPTLAITPDLTEITDTRPVSFIATPTGGLYDEIEYEWFLDFGGGRFGSEGISAPLLQVMTNPFEVLDTSSANFEVREQGGLYDEIEFEWDISGPGELGFERATAPVVSIQHSIAGLSELETATFQATPQGGLYDEIVFEWEIASGGGTLEVG